ncbi:hypothetical protein [Halobellus rarus]|uniref:DUF3566 domain-containing protein n=1 Tax=Halobellus rarus TaxID=1126237 RepID=A0ABD6CUM2_9EURY|nr:hypothetical protein [Halobellus rarus]
MSSRLVPDSEEVAENNGTDDDDGGGLVASEVRSIVAGMFVGGIIAFVSELAGLGIDIVDTIRSSLTSAGSGIADEAGSLSTTVVEVVIETPLEAAGDLATSTWIFAPISSALVFVLVAAISALIIYGTWRALVVIT